MKIMGFIQEHIIIISIVLILLFIGVLFHYLNWWEVLGLFILNVGLGIKVKGATTVAATVLKAGGKKAVAMTATGVLFKRHAIDLVSKFLAEHSISRYKANIISLTKIKLKHMRDSKPIQKIKAALGIFTIIPVGYYLWAKVLAKIMGTALQKVFYFLIWPIVIVIWESIVAGLNWLTAFISFIFQITLLNILLDRLEKYRLGKIIIKSIYKIVFFLGELLEILNKLFIWIGFDPKHELIYLSIKFNRYLESKINHGKNAVQKIKTRRSIHITSREILTIKRTQIKIKKKNRSNWTKNIKEIYRIKVQKNLTYKEKRQRRAYAKTRSKSRYSRR